MNNTPYRPGLPPVPARLRSRPIVRGYPVPWFVAQLDDGSYDFRIADGSRFPTAIKDQRCWICGQRLGSYKAFTIGPMCAINRTAPEPPSHRECAEWSAIACPFLNQHQHKRREGNMPEVDQPAGDAILRQAGVTLVWITKSFTLFGDGRGGTLVEIGDPLETIWYAHGRTATRDEIMASIESGLPILREKAEEEGPRAVAALDRYIDRAMQYVPT